MDGELQQAAIALDSSGAGYCRCIIDIRTPVGPKNLDWIYYVFTRCGGRNRHCRRIHVSLPDAIVEYARCQSHRLGQRVQSSHTGNHVLDNSHFYAFDSSLYLVGLPCDAGKSDRAANSGQRTQCLLK